MAITGDNIVDFEANYSDETSVNVKDSYAEEYSGFKKWIIELEMDQIGDQNLSIKGIDASGQEVSKDLPETIEVLDPIDISEELGEIEGIKRVMPSSNEVLVNENFCIVSEVDLSLTNINIKNSAGMAMSKIYSTSIYLGDRKFFITQISIATASTGYIISVTGINASGEIVGQYKELTVKTVKKTKTEGIQGGILEAIVENPYIQEDDTLNLKVITDSTVESIDFEDNLGDNISIEQGEYISHGEIKVWDIDVNLTSVGDHDIIIKGKNSNDIVLPITSNINAIVGETSQPEPEPGQETLPDIYSVSIKVNMMTFATWSSAYGLTAGKTYKLINRAKNTYMEYEGSKANLKSVVKVIDNPSSSATKQMWKFFFSSSTGYVQLQSVDNTGFSINKYYSNSDEVRMATISAAGNDKHWNMYYQTTYNGIKYYKVESVSNRGKFLRVVSSSNGHMLRAEKYNSASANSFLWGFTDTSAPPPPPPPIPAAEGITNGGVYTIVNANSNKVLDVSGANTGNNTKVLQYRNDGRNHQKWIVLRLSDGYYRISPLHASSKNLDLRASSLASGTDVEIYGNQPNGTPYNSSKWKITYNENAGNIEQAYTIRAWNTNMALVIDNSSHANGVRSTINTYTKNLVQNDQWYFIPVAPVNHYKTVNVVKSDGFRRQCTANGLLYDRELSQTVTAMAVPFYRSFGIRFDTTYSDMPSSILEQCPRGYYSRCSATNCGACETNGNPRHHKNLVRIAREGRTRFPGSHNISFVAVPDGQYCMQSGGDHGTPGAVMDSPRDARSAGNSSGKFTIKNKLENYRMMQHEFTHYIGPNDHDPRQNDPCILNGFSRMKDLNLKSIWCLPCLYTISRTL